MISEHAIPRSIDDSACQAFEQAWLAKRAEPIERFLPQSDHPLYVATLEELVQIELEFAWNAFASGGPTPTTIEDYLRRFPELDEPKTLLRLLRQEFRVRRGVPNAPTLADYVRRFPNAVVSGAEITSGLDEGIRLTGYEILGEVGAGGMGVVYQARQPGLDRVVAIKTIRGHRVGHPATDRFLAEARVAARLEHPGVVPVHEVGASTEIGPYYTMKLVHGQTLEEAIRKYHTQDSARSVLEQQRLLRAFVAVCQTMAFAHARGVIHRDLKPANIVLGEFGETVILDWGLAKEARSADRVIPSDNVSLPADSGETVAGTILGTPAFMSPEQACGEVVDSRSDIFSLGAILFNLLTGRPPFIGSSSQSVLEEVRACLPARLRSVNAQIPRPMEAICLKALAKQPEERYADAGKLARDVELFLAGERVSAYAEPWGDRVGRWARRHRTGVGIASVAAILLIVSSITGLFLWREGEHRRDKQRADFEHKQREDRDATLRAMERAIGEDERLAEAEFLASHFASAERILAKAALAVRNEPEMEEILIRVDAQRKRAQQLADYYRLSDRAEQLANTVEESQFGQNDRAVLSTCSAALEKIGALRTTGNWWEEFSSKGLQNEQLTRLESSVAGLMLFRALWLSKQGLLEQYVPLAKLFGKGKGVDEPFREARALLNRVQRYYVARHGRRSSVAEVQDLVCRFALGEKGLPSNVRPEPLTAMEAYLLGVTHTYLGAPDATGVREIIARAFPQELRKLTGLDFETPLATGIYLLRDALTRDPSHFWSHYALGGALTFSHDYSGAEGAFNACIALRPEQIGSYYDRSAILRLHVHDLQKQTRSLTEESLSIPLAVALGVTSGDWPSLFDRYRAARSLESHERVSQYSRSIQTVGNRALEGLQQGLAVQPHHRAICWLRAILLAELVRESEVPAAYASAVECYLAHWLAIGTKPDIELAQVNREWGLNYTSVRASVTPNDPEAKIALAMACLPLDKLDDASRILDSVIAINPTNARALAIQGTIALKKGSKEAEATFDRALTADPRNILAQFGRLKAIEKSGDAERLLNAANDLLTKFEPKTRQVNPQDWRILGIHLTRARVLVKLDRIDEAKLALEEARQIDIDVAETVGRELLRRSSTREK